MTSWVGKLVGIILFEETDAVCAGDVNEGKQFSGWEMDATVISLALIRHNSAGMKREIIPCDSLVMIKRKIYWALRRELVQMEMQDQSQNNWEHESNSQLVSQIVDVNMDAHGITSFLSASTQTF